MPRTSVVDIHKIRGKRPEFDVYIGRRTRNTEFTEDSKWNNPRLTLDEYKRWIIQCICEQPEYFDLDELRGKYV